MTLVIGMGYSTSYAQQTLFDEPSVVYKKMAYGGIQLHSNGWGLSGTLAKNKTIDKANFFQLDIVGMKHPKEVRVYSVTYVESRTRSYIYGKLNSLMTIRPMYGQRKVLNDKIRKKNGAQVGYYWAVGPSLGLVKPVYLEINEGVSLISQTSVERYDPAVHNPNNIVGRASWFRGLDELQLYPGAAIKFAGFIELSPKKKGYKSISVGAVIDAYGREVPILNSDEQNRQLFWNFFVAMDFGARYNNVNE